MQASEPLLRFITAARGAGVRISPAESIDAMRAAEIVGYDDRNTLRDALGLVLAKTPEEKASLVECFDLYFRRDEIKPDEPAPEHELAFGPVGEGAGGTGAGSALGRMLQDNDAAALSAAMERAGEDAGLPNIRFFTQRNLYTRRVLERMGLRDLEAEIGTLRRDALPESIAQARRLEAALASLRTRTRDLVDRSLVLFARGETEEFREELLKSSRLSNVDRRDYERMHTLVHAMARRLATRYAKPRRRHLRGQLDIRRTLRRNMGWGGVPFVTVWKERRIEKPRVIVLCDVSGSVAAFAQFLLMFLYAMNEALADVRSFAFAGSLIEVTGMLESNPIEQAIAKILSVIGYGSSNYGNALADFAEGWLPIVDRKSTVIILGDARGNRSDPRTHILQTIATRAKRVIWLNPEYRSSWGTGDSDMFRYTPYCHMVRVCGTLRDLERAVSDLLGGVRA